MSNAERKLLFLTVEGDDKGFGSQLASSLPTGQSHQVLAIEPANYETILDHLESGEVLPVVLKVAD